ncbi:MAG: helix-turn-helix transcriptional regulator [Christensenellaceae bacterium]|nr:helix-turn-helix transcriptional regulator [Christensenellaceae bacterium]
MTYNSKITGNIIRRLRIERHLTQEVLSGLAGIARSHLAMIENGNKNPNVETLWRIAWAFEIPLSDLFKIIEKEMNLENK